MGRIVFLGMLFAVGCDVASSEACEPQPFRLISMNGSTMQGTRMQGTKFQGNKNQGVDYQGSTIQGSDMQGTRLQGSSIQGTRLQGIELVDGVLVATDADGRALDQTLFVGAQVPSRLDTGELIDLEIAAIDGPFVTLTFEGESICADGEYGIFVPGTWDETGARRDALADAPEFDATYSCESGVIAKCVAWGYAPWEVGADVHQTCTRMARADYCGDGISYTKDGTVIDLVDRLGIQQSTPDAELEFEAGWGPDGAVCASRPRYQETVVGEGEQLPTCWDRLPACEDLDEAFTSGATLANRSYPAERLFCSVR